MNQPTEPGTAVESVNAESLLLRYKASFTNSLPTHVVASQWLSVARGALRDPKIRQAADNDPGAFLAAMLQASRLGLEPGTEQFYLVPQPPKKGMPPVIRGNVGYQGLVELMYRAGAVASVIVEVVYTNDRFSYVPGRDERPVHEIDWDAENRGDLRLAYAYAVMKDGATSKVIVLNRSDIARIKAVNPFSTSPHSPWVKHPASMWLKSAARQLAKWVPTSAEYRRQQLRDAQAVADERARESTTTALHIPDAAPAGDGYIDPLTGEIIDGDSAGDDNDDQVFDAEVVDEVVAEASGEAGPVTRDGAAAAQGVDVQAAPSPRIVNVAEQATVPDAAPSAVEDAEPVVEQVKVLPLKAAQTSTIRTECARLGIQANPAEKVYWLGQLIGRELDDVKALSRDEADQVIDALQQFPDRAALEEWGSGQDPLGDGPAS